MRDNPINALRETLRCGFAFRKSRLESLCVLVFGVFVARTVNLSHLACHFPAGARDPAPTIGACNGFSSKSISITIASPSSWSR